MIVSPVQRPRVRRDVNLTAVLVTIVLVGGVLALAWIGAAAVLALQGLDTRNMLSVRLGPKEWATAGGFIAGLGGYLAMLRRMGKNERALRSELPEHVDAATTAAADQVAAAVNAAVAPLMDLVGDLVDALDDSHARARREGQELGYDQGHTEGVTDGMARVLEHVRAHREATGQLPRVVGPADMPWADLIADPPAPGR